jgi:hypothetical protein
MLAADMEVSMFLVPQLAVFRRVGFHSRRIGHAGPSIGLDLGSGQAGRRVRAHAAAPPTARDPWRGLLIRGCAYVPEVALYLVVGAVLAWEPAGGRQVGLLLPALMLLVVGLPWARGMVFAETLASVPIPAAAPTGRQANASSGKAAVPRALHRDARFGR